MIFSFFRGLHEPNGRSSASVMNAELLISRIFPANERQSVFLPVNSWFGQRKCSRKPRPERRPWNTMNFVAQSTEASSVRLLERNKRILPRS